MALFQITEPGESRAKQACTTGAVGIDLGTTNSLIAIVLADGKPHALAVDEAQDVRVHQRVAGLHGEPSAAERHDLRCPLHRVRRVGPIQGLSRNFIPWSSAVGPSVE